jgi:hypothetical protein
MDYNENNFDIISIDDKINIIEKTFKLINSSINIYNNKKLSIVEKIEMLNNKTNLHLDNTTNFLKFQNKMINNEIDYLISLKDTIEIKFNEELNKISDKLIFIYISTINLNKDMNQDHISKIKKPDTKINNILLIKDILSNFDNLKTLLLKLKEYNENLDNEMRKGNYHCNTLNIDLMTKRFHIFLEYKKLVHYFEETIKYFTSLCKSANNNLDNTSIFNFLVSNNSAENSVNNNIIITNSELNISELDDDIFLQNDIDNI